MELIYIRKGVRKLTRKNFEEISDETYCAGMKPYGGLWFSEYTPMGRYVSSYQKWAHDEGYSYMDTVHDAVIFTVRPEARWLVIDNPEAAKLFKLKYGIGENPNLDCWDHRNGFKKIDWLAVKNDYDVFYCNPACREGEVFSILDGIDMECGLILNWDAIHSQRYLPLNTIRFPDVVWHGLSECLDSLRRKLAYKMP